MCIWCETANMCITSNDKDIHKFKVNGCQGKSSIVTVPTTPTLAATTETDLGNELKKTSGSTESHLNMTTDTTTLATTETDLKKTSGSTESHLNMTTDTTTLATTETDLKKTSGSTESHLNMTTDTTEDTEERKSLQYALDYNEIVKIGSKWRSHLAEAMCNPKSNHQFHLPAHEIAATKYTVINDDDSLSSYGDSGHREYNYDRLLNKDNLAIFILRIKEVSLTKSTTNMSELPGF
ncbi:unnamed protein product [Schistosoma margrebowiei]|uniref:Uncharacterized protein n=1 Tax=Schistosoma margrebowiei TaxID=48269 RepID=A0AA85AHN0_9TREM|nr:unnamed protein product [Schistosoma margrebowiei]